MSMDSEQIQSLTMTRYLIWAVFMSPDKQLFDTYKSYEGGIVMTGNHISCKTAVLERLKKMFDGVVRMLTDMTHIQDLRLSLISLDTFDSTAMVVTKGEKKGCLHKLIDELVIEGVAVTSSEDHDVDIRRYGT